MNIRVGQGFDSHALVAGLPMYMGGVQVPHHSGAKGHSDGDCLLHALTDALLGALGLGDIGGWFADTDPRWRGMRSAEFLKRVMQDPGTPRFRVINADMTVFLNEPKLKPHKAAIEESVAGMLGVDAALINVKAKTWEGFQVQSVISASVVVLVELE